jgi:hypothetical protein
VKRDVRRKMNYNGDNLCEICGNIEILVQHHIRGRKVHNANHYSNLANICNNCHTKVHHGIIIIENRCHTTNGFVLVWHYYKDTSITGNDANVFTF